LRATSAPKWRREYRRRSGVGRYDKAISADEREIRCRHTEVRRCWRRWQTAGDRRRAKKPFVILVVGVNGSGKTTTIGKLAAKLSAEGRKVMLGGRRTPSRPAIEQLKIWGERTKISGDRRCAGLGLASLGLPCADVRARGKTDVPFDRHRREAAEQGRN